MNACEMIPGVPYVVTRGSAALHLVAGDRVEVCVGTGALIDHKGIRRREWRGYQLNVERDRAGCMEQAALLRRRADLLDKLAAEVEG
jgi:hypothetical protein